MKIKVVLSAFISGIFGISTYFILHILSIGNKFLLSIFSGLLVFTMLLTFLIIYEYIQNKKYSKIEKEITSPIFYKANGNFILPYKKNGNIYFCETGIICVCMEEKPYVFDEIKKENIDKYQFDTTWFKIFTKSGQVYLIMLPDALKIIAILRAKHWIS